METLILLLFILLFIATAISAAMFAILSLAEHPDFQRWRARAERDLYAARQTLDAAELKRAVQRDATRLRRELTRELKDLDA